MDTSLAPAAQGGVHHQCAHITLVPKVRIELTTPPSSGACSTTELLRREVTNCKIIHTTWQRTPRTRGPELTGCVNYLFGAGKRTRTSTFLRTLAPEASASTNSATPARPLIPSNCAGLNAELRVFAARRRWGLGSCLFC
jgi:hypothetical protein